MLSLADVTAVAGEEEEDEEEEEQRCSLPWSPMNRTSMCCSLDRHQLFNSLTNDACREERVKEEEEKDEEVEKKKEKGRW